MRRIRVALVSPEIHRLGGTERSYAEAVERWGSRFDLTIYSMRVDGVETGDARVRKVVDLPGPHLGRYVAVVPREPGSPVVRRAFAARRRTLSLRRVSTASTPTWSGSTRCSVGTGGTRRGDLGPESILGADGRG